VIVYIDGYLVVYMFYKMLHQVKSVRFNKFNIYLCI